MTDILELARKVGFIKQDISLAHEAIEKNVYLVPSDSHLREFASLLREKFIKEAIARVDLAFLQLAAPTDKE